MDDRRTGLRQELLDLFDRGADTPLSDEAFTRLALRVLAHNAEAVPAYGAYCRAQGRPPPAVDHWTRIPAVPTAAFKELPLRDEGRPTEAVFRTSGTTRGRERRGEHHVADLDLYRGSLRATFRDFLLPDGIRPRFLSLMPPPDRLPDSSLAFMIDDVMAVFGAEDSAVFADGSHLDLDGLGAAVEGASTRGRPVLLIGTSAAFIHWLDHLADRDHTLHLPPGSRLMDTGGFKGRGRHVPPLELRRAYTRRLGIPPPACVNEYGMTELLSQLYDSGLRDSVLDLDRPQRKRGPAWLRSVAVDPESLEPLPAGTPGLLRHVDLANLHSVAAVQTEDFGAVDEHGLSLEGRAAGATPRGCSIAMDLLLEGA
jgi:hypothetical protein